MRLFIIVGRTYINNFEFTQVLGVVDEDHLDEVIDKMKKCTTRGSRLIKCPETRISIEQFKLNNVNVLGVNNG